MNLFKLIDPSAIDPAGILMLRSIRIVFDLIQIRPESIKFTKEEFGAENLIKALTEAPKKCPSIITMNLLGHNSPHVMVATNALKGCKFIKKVGPISQMLKNEWFINCKNTFRDNIEEPGIVFVKP